MGKSKYLEIDELEIKIERLFRFLGKHCFKIAIFIKERRLVRYGFISKQEMMKQLKQKRIYVSKLERN